MREPDHPYQSQITLSDLSHVVLAAREANELFEETTWWRGHANAEWRLQAQIYRENPENRDRLSDAETALIGHFVSRAPSRSHRPCPAADDYFGWLFLAQHYGLPTRLLDWTENPLVAAYFAVERPDVDGCIWGLSPTGLNCNLAELDGLAMMQNQHAKKIAKNAFTRNGLPEPVAIAIDGQEIDPRMLAQMSRFTVHSESTPLDELMYPESAKWLCRYIIPKDAKDKISKQLSAFGIRRSNLFPDLVSLATELKSQFW